MRVVFMASGDIAVPAFQWALAQRGVTVVALVTQPDKPIGRHQTLTASPIKQIALRDGVAVLQPESIRKSRVIDEIVALNADVMVVMAYGQLLTERLIGAARVACWNLHASLLPKFRGAACIQAAIDAGEQDSGITVMHVAKALDAGDIVLQRAIELSPQETGVSLHDRLAVLAASALEQAFLALSSGQTQRLPQDHSRASHVGKLLRDDGWLSLHASLEQVERRIRAYDPWPGTFLKLVDGRRLKLFPPVQFCDESSIPLGMLGQIDGKWGIGWSGGTLLLGDVQQEGGKRMSAEVWSCGLRGATVQLSGCDSKG